jgi:hypothetical protein
MAPKERDKSKSKVITGNILSEKMQIWYTVHDYVSGGLVRCVYKGTVSRYGGLDNPMEQ